MKQFALFNLLIIFSCAGCVSHTGEQESSAHTETENHFTYKIIRDQVYTPTEWPEALAADIYVPDGAGSFPAVLLVHGGGWEGRSREDMQGIAEELAQRGFVAVNVSYRFAPEYRFPEQIYDLQLAVRWMRNNSAQFHIDSERVGAYGFSSGGHLVLMLATISAEDVLDEPYGGADTRLQAVVAGSAPTDLRKFKGGTLVPRFLGKTFAEAPDLFALASPIVHVTPDDPAMFIYHGGLDRLVDDSHALDMKQALDNAGVLSELYIVKYLGHITLFVLNHSAVDAGISFLKRQLSRTVSGIRKNRNHGHSQANISYSLKLSVPQ